MSGERYSEREADFLSAIYEVAAQDFRECIEEAANTDAEESWWAVEDCLKDMARSWGLAYPEVFGWILGDDTTEIDIPLPERGD